MGEDSHHSPFSHHLHQAKRAQQRMEMNQDQPSGSSSGEMLVSATSLQLLRSLGRTYAQLTQLVCTGRQEPGLDLDLQYLCLDPPELITHLCECCEGQEGKGGSVLGGVSVEVSLFEPATAIIVGQWILGPYFMVRSMCEDPECNMAPLPSTRGRRVRSDEAAARMQRHHRRGSVNYTVVICHRAE